MIDDETEFMYEIELMLGRTDETHIIRTIEYWDLERRRRPDSDHRAVIVAEEITNRFFNVISLLNRAIPMIAIQLNAFLVDEKLVLHCTKVLDMYESPEDEEEEAEPTDRQWWESRSNAKSLEIVDRCAALLTEGGRRPRITYNKSHIAMGAARQNFAWFHPRKAQSHCHFDLRTGDANQQAVLTQFQEIGVNVKPRRKDKVRIIITPKEMREHEAMVESVLRAASDEAGGPA